MNQWIWFIDSIECWLNCFNRCFRLHEVLMDLQHQQLQQLSDWLKETEGRIRKMETEPTAGDMPGYLAQIEQHRVSELSDWCFVTSGPRKLINSLSELFARSWSQVSLAFLAFKQVISPHVRHAISAKKTECHMVYYFYLMLNISDLMNPVFGSLKHFFLTWKRRERNVWLFVVKETRP